TFQITAVVSLVILAVLGSSWWKAQPATDDMLETRVLEMLDQLLIKTRFAQFPFLPSYWLSTSVIQWVVGVVTLAGFFILVLVIKVSFFSFLAFPRLGAPFYGGVSAVQSRASIWNRWHWPFGRSSQLAGNQLLVGRAPPRADTRTKITITETIFSRL